MAKKLTRVSLQYEDGTIQRLIGSEADKWLTAVNGCCHVSQLHHCPMPDFEWEDANLEAEVRILRPEKGDIVVVEHCGSPDGSLGCLEGIRNALPEGAYLVVMLPGTDIYSIKMSSLFPAPSKEEEDPRGRS